MAKKNIEHSHQTAFQKHMEKLKDTDPQTFGIYNDLSKITPPKSTLNITSEWKELKPKITRILKTRIIE